ncbi:MAG: protein translocase SEC61 complex subunit gamma [Candidatus Nitrosopelagicus sp.]|jgi:protein transport protein SEC61 subunit gamma-like protein|nr:protein translocase SEC61 complex subunit gamma [Candidatus Nitrosopelagicus sp.]|tara:strand:- start:97 stop:276 length:180 start_codon:yes stop_codon:yes gene_type:complete
MKINLQRTLMNMKNTIKLTKKSDKDVYFQHLRLVLFGIASVGAIGFGIQFVFSVMTFGR